MGQTDQRTDLLRILLADDDDVSAFTVQFAINRLSKPSAFLRIDNRDILAQKIRSFEPEMLVASGHFASPGELRQIKTLTNGSPIICVVKTRADAEASMAAGATDCVLSSQENGIGECLEKHLNGRRGEPHFHSAPPEPKSALVAAEQKLEQLDRRIAEYLRNLAKTTGVQWERLKVAAGAACAATRASLENQYRQVKVKYLARKQHRLVQRAAPMVPNEPRADTAPADLASSWKTVLTDEAAPPETRSPAPPQAEEGKEALRAMELSFKTLFHTALDAMFLADGAGSVLHVNPAACAMLGITPPDILGKSLFDFVPASDKVRASAMWEALLIEGQQKVDLLLETAGGEKREVFLSARANLWFGVHLLVFRDQTEVRKLQREASALRELNQVSHQTSTGPLGTGIASRCAEAGSMKEENSGAGR